VRRCNLVSLWQARRVSHHQNYYPAPQFDLRTQDYIFCPWPKQPYTQLTNKTGPARENPKAYKPREFDSDPCNHPLQC